VAAPRGSKAEVGDNNGVSVAFSVGPSMGVSDRFSVERITTGATDGVFVGLSEGYEDIVGRGVLMGVSDGFSVERNTTGATDGVSVGLAEGYNDVVGRGVLMGDSDGFCVGVLVGGTESMVVGVGVSGAPVGFRPALGVWVVGIPDGFVDGIAVGFWEDSPDGAWVNNLVGIEVIGVCFFEVFLEALGFTSLMVGVPVVKPIVGRKSSPLASEGDELPSCVGEGV